ncbi:related to ADP-ribosylation factor GTPase-activating protein [Ramularia collo-cygni]|uniref:Related to ADP-ribosylation factor GTPase-activating protein n=1 Tax=Ramularia collo-cygni TaxID=112498 RepID=A0A2D3V353_9PEZI|nr:related to ADP-ribosylation factor GTPase-activating protein [Ramularia collo-cygni]CZT14703.1 related to ADP-ribosylation factor GTPase-activating protein [Ramularia collo-cygni]
MSGKMWEVDPETRSKLLEISKSNENSRCVDCGAPSPQWASPKLGIFFCLACSGTHRSLGVHISFVRSVTMDAFKQGEVARMAAGGNAPWRDFFNQHPSNTLLGRDFDACTIAERYDSEAGEEWKERLTAKVEEREYVPGEKKAVPVKKAATPAMSAAGSGRSTPMGSAPPQRVASPSQKARNEAYFASKGQENEHRPEGVAPSQGGKYAGFGSSPMPTSSNTSSGGVPTANDFQNDPVAALTKGFGWLSSTVTKQAATVNKTYIQPGLSNLAQADLAAQARATAAQLGSTVQQGTKGLGDQFQRFVDPDAASSGSGGIARGGQGPAKKDFWDSFGEAPAGPAREKKDFWDEFAAVGEQVQSKKSAGSSSIGTSAMKPGGASGKKDEEDGWGGW